MDFHALPRRDLQALCKRNGVRANMTNAAMADALSALTTIDGVEEYVRQPAAVPEPAGKAVVVEEVRPEKQGSPLPRGRSVAARTSEVVRPDPGKGKEDEKTESNRVEDATAHGVGRRGPGRRARPAAKAVAEKQVDGVEEHVKRPAAVPEPVRQAAAAVSEEEVRRSKREEDATKHVGVGRRGPSRRARPTTEQTAAAAAEKQGSPPQRTQREPVRPEDGVEKEALKRDTNKEDAPVQGAGRRGPSRSARGAPVVAASTAEPQPKAAAVEEEQKQGSKLPRARRVTWNLPEPARQDDSVEKEEVDTKRVPNDDEAPVQGVGRRGATRRARPAPVVSKPAAKAMVEELESPLPRGRRVTVDIKSTAAISTECGEEDKNKDIDLKQEASKGNAQARGMGRRCAGRRARPEPAVSAPVDDVPVEKDALIPHGRHSKVKSREPIVLDGSDEEDQDELEAKKKEEKVPAQGLVRRGPSRRTRTAPVEAPATTMSAASSIEERDVPVETVHVRPTLVRKSTMKAAAVAEDKVSQRTIKMAAPRPPQEAVPEPLSEEACHDLENVEVAVDPQNLEQSEVIDEQRQADEGVSEVVMNENEILMDDTPEEKTPVTNDILIEEAVPTPLSEEACHDQGNVEEAAGSQNIEQNEVIDKSRQEDEGISEVVMSENEILMDETSEEKPPVTNDILIEEAVPAPLSEEACHDQENVEEAAGSQNSEQSEVVDKPRKEDAVVMNEDETMMGESSAQKLPVTNEIVMEMAVPALLSEEAYDVDNLEEAAHPQNLEQSEVVEEQRHEDEEVMMNVRETMMDEFLAEKPPMTNEILMEVACHALDNLEEAADSQNFEQSEDEEAVMNEEEITMDGSHVTPAEKQPVTKEILMDKTLAKEPPAIAKECTGNLAMEELECKDRSPLEEQVDVEHCSSRLPNQEDLPILGLISTFAEPTVEKDQGAHFQEGSGPCEGRLDKGMYEENNHAGKEMLVSPVIQTLQEPLTAAESADDHGSEMEISNSLQGKEETTMVDIEDGLVCRERGVGADDDVESQSKKVDAAVVLDCSNHIILALVDDITKKMARITITKPTTTRNEDLPLCMNSSVNNTAEPVCGNSSEKNTDEPVHEDKSENTTDLMKLSRRKLKMKLKEALERKKAKRVAKRVALARVDENICRSNSAEQY